MEYSVYVMTNKPRGTLFVGITSQLTKRAYQHKMKQVDGFSSKYDLSMLVYYEVFNEINEALKREKQLKKWNRIWKVELIENNNPEWEDLYESLI